MQSLRNKRRFLAGLLVLLLFGNSSYALEILIHESHGHAQAVTSSLPAHTQTHAHMATNSQVHSQAHTQSHDHAGHAGMDRQATPAAQDEAQLLDAAGSADEADDCICDDICCVSSVQFSTVANGSTVMASSVIKRRPLNFYQSISLDLLLPPPTR